MRRRTPRRVRHARGGKHDDIRSHLHDGSNRIGQVRVKRSRQQLAIGSHRASRLSYLPPLQGKIPHVVSRSRPVQRQPEHGGGCGAMSHRD